MTQIAEERKGEAMVLLQAVIYGGFPVLINSVTNTLPPLFYAGSSFLVAGLLLLLIALMRGELRDFYNWKGIKNAILVTVIGILMAYSLIFIGTSYTSSINTSLLLQTEILFTLVICGVFFGEQITKRKVVAAFVMFIGSLLVLYNGELALNIGDILILVAMSLFPFSNFFAKRAMKEISTFVVLSFRSLVGGVVMLAVSTHIYSFSSSLPHLVFENAEVIFLNGVVMLGVTKVLWYEGMKRMEINKAINIGMSYVGFSLLYAYLFLQEVPTFYQLGGLVFMLMGLYLATFKTVPQALPESA